MRLPFPGLPVGALAFAVLAGGGKTDTSRNKQRSKPDASTPAREEAPELDAFWDDPSYTIIGDQAPCPEGFWALFGGDPPGATKGEQKGKLAKKPELEKA